MLSGWLRHSAWRGPFARRTHCVNSLKRLGIRIHNEHDVVGSLSLSWTGGGINCLIRRGEDSAMLTFGEDIRPYRADRFEFSTDGKFLAWSNSDGTIDMADLDVIRRGDEIGRQEK